MYTNSQMRNKEVKQFVYLEPEAENFLKVAAEKFDFPPEAISGKSK